MCAKFAEAARLVPALRNGLHPLVDPPQGVQLDSAFALLCAGHMCSCKINPKILQLQGMGAFVAVARQLTKVNVVCSTLLEAAQAGYVLEQCSAVTELYLSGNCMPAILPSTVTDLTARFSPPGVSECDTTQPDALIYHAALLPNLAKLRLWLPGSKSHVPRPFDHRLQLRLLQSLNVQQIRLSGPYLDFSWVRKQPTCSLELGIVADNSNIATHAAVVQQLSQLLVSTLTLETKVQFTSELQALWGGLKVNTFSLDMRAATLEPLRMLPQCSRLIWTHFPDDVSSPAYVSWQAFTSRAIKIRLFMEGELHVMGASSSAADHLAQPWQLQIDHVSEHHGLPPSQPTTDCRYFLQNAAARAAGWTYWSGLSR